MTTSPEETLIKIEAMASAIARADASAKPALLHQYLDLIGHYLIDQGRGDALAFPLLDVIEQLDASGRAPQQVERRHGEAECSDELLAKVSAVIDVLVSSGYSTDHASQLVTRQMIARNIQLPAGGDARAWRNIQAFRHKLINSKHEGVLWRVYTNFKAELPQLYGSRLAEAAAREAVWDRRSKASA